MKNSVRKEAALGQGLKNTNKWKSRERLARENEKEEPTERWKESQKKEASGGEGREFLDLKSVSDLGYNKLLVILARPASVEWGE